MSPCESTMRLSACSSLLLYMKKRTVQHLRGEIKMRRTTQ